MEIYLEKILSIGTSTAPAATSAVLDTRHCRKARGLDVGRPGGAGTERVGWRRAKA